MSPLLCGRSAHTNEWLCVEVEEGVCVPFAVHANLTLNMCEGTCSLLWCGPCPSQAPQSSPLSPRCQGVSSLRAHSQPVPRGGTPQPRQGVLCEEMCTPEVPDHPPLHAVGW